MENLFTMPKKIIVLGTLFFLFSCSQDEMVNSEVQKNASQSLTGKISADKLVVFKGPQVILGYGKIRSWMSVDRNGFPNEIGIELTPEAFKNLTDEEDTKVPPEHATIVVPLHFIAKK